MSDRCREVYDYWLAHGQSVRGTARGMCLDRSTVQGHLARAAKLGWSPGLTKAPEVAGMAIVKTTVQYDEAGKLVNDWRRLVPEMQEIEDWVKTLEDRVAGKAPRIKAPTKANDDLLLEIAIGDHHLGMLSWPEETGEGPYDSKIAVDLLVGAVGSVIAGCERPDKIVLAVLGDFFHADSRVAQTEKSKAPLDVDSRFCKRMDMGMEAMCRCIELAEAAAKEVEVVIISGNHDYHSAKYLQRVLAAYYRREKSIVIRTNPKLRQYLQWGKVLLGYAHGDTVKTGKWALAFPIESAEMWSKTEFRYGRQGHFHTRVTEEYPGVVIETLPSLAAPDAWTVESGYHSRRAITAYLWSKRYGLRSKMERGVQEILDYIKKSA